MRRYGPEGIESEGIRKILLFSDGTGNSSGKLQRTNVWRLYEALDLGYPVDTDQAVQIAYYDDGVGTSSIKFLAILGGVFGFGLARNVRDIYKFLCRNYRPGDQIYAFGFSRGAYTIRLLVALVTLMGLVPYNQNEEELDLAARDNWRELRRRFRANNVLADFLVEFGRWLFRTAIAVKRRLFGQIAYAEHVPIQRCNWIVEWWETTRDRWKGFFTGTPPVHNVEEYGPDIEFVGVWDTVAAYGGPIVEFTRAIDEWIWPITMPNYRLSPKVRVARHALAIDDKRESFTPLLWDEVHEKSLAGYDADNPRLQQVWFAGMHSDVGGGYSDDSLAYVSLWWMIQHAEQGGQGIRLLPEFRSRIETFRNIYGPIHDSRGGGGIFYRYQPRYLNAWIDGRPGSPILRASQSFRDPTVDHGRYRSRGLLNFPIRLHRSVQERLRMATDGYAPNNLPSRYIVDDGPAGTSPPDTTPLSATNAADHHSLANLRACIDRLSQLIKLRRFWYFVSVWLAAGLALKPLWPAIPLLRSMVGTVDVRTDAHRLEEAANAFFPSFAHEWTAAIAADPFVSAAVAGLLLLTSALGFSQERQMSDVAGRMWRQRLSPGTAISAPRPPNMLQAAMLRTASIFYRSDGLAKLLAWIKWRAIPYVLGAILWLLGWYVAAAIIVQLLLIGTEAHVTRCPVAPVRPAASEAVVDIASPCANTGFSVISVGNDMAEKHYLVSVRLRDGNGDPGNWMDGGQPADPNGWIDPDSRVLQWLAWPFQRVTTARLMQPIFEIRRQQRLGFLGNERWPFDDIYMMRPVLTEQDDGSWEGEIIIPRRGHGEAEQELALYAFVNDAVFPIDKVVPASRLERSAGKQKCVPSPDSMRGSLLSGIRLFPLEGRYRNNCGQMEIRLKEQP